MAMTELRLQKAADAAAEQARLINLVLADGAVTDDEVSTLQEVARLAAANSFEIQDTVGDIKLATQILRVGRQNAPNVHLHAELMDLEAMKQEDLAA